MSDHSIDAVAVFDDQGRPAGERPPEALRVRRRVRVPRRDWRLGGRTVLHWREWLLALALVSLGLGVLLGALLSASATPLGTLAAQAVLWLGMLVPVVWAFARSRPAGLLRFRALDLLWGLALALALRLAQGWLEAAFGGSAALPSYPTVGGSLPEGWWFSDLVAVVLIAPVVEELFFRGIVLVALFTVLRRVLGKPLAGVIAVLVSTAIFTVVHGINGALDLSQVVAIGLLGLACAVLVVLTGRIWGAVLVHSLYNASFVALALAGTLLG